jgi:hypothetical protein
MTLPQPPAHERRNRAAWNADADDYQARHGQQLAGDGGKAWGTWNLPESELGVLGEVIGQLHHPRVFLQIEKLERARAPAHHAPDQTKQQAGSHPDTGSGNGWERVVRNRAGLGRIGHVADDVGVRDEAALPGPEPLQR